MTTFVHAHIHVLENTTMKGILLTVHTNLYIQGHTHKPYHIHIYMHPNRHEYKDKPTNA